LEQRLHHIEFELGAARKELEQLRRMLREREGCAVEERKRFEQEKQQAEELIKVP